jgi:hypothetical protein
MRGVRMLKSLIVALLGAVFVAGAGAQPPADEDTGPDVLWTSVENLLGPEDLGMKKLSAGDDLYEALTGSRRCNPEKPSKPREPCAFISYAPSGSNEEAYANTLRPVFRIFSRDKVWSVVDGRLARISVDQLEVARDLREPSGDPTDKAYPAVGVIGWAENLDRCKAKKKCIDMTYYQKLVSEVGILSDGCVEEIWNPKSGATGVGEQSRCRYSTDRDHGE